MVFGVPALGWSGATLFELAERSTSIAYGRVTGVDTYKDGTFQVFTVEPERVLSGDLGAGEPFQLVQERLFETSKPYFAKGVRTLIFAKPLPRYTLYQEALPEGSYLQWAERLDTAAEVASLRDPSLIEPVATYLARREDPEALARHLGALTASPVPRLRQGALGMLEERPDLVPILDAEALAPVRAFLLDARVPLPDRADTLVRLARMRAAAMVPIAEETAARGGPLLAPAVDALVSLDRLPDEERLLGYSRSKDEALRLAAVRGLVKDGSAAAFARVEEVIASDTPPVRHEALRRLGFIKGPGVVKILIKAVLGEDEDAAVVAAEGLGREGGDVALSALERALLERPNKVKAAAAFALKQSGMQRGEDFLRSQSRGNPDHEIQRLCKLALGESMHDH